MKIPVFLSTAIVCPKCGSMIDKLPPGMEEAISNGDSLACTRCSSRLVIRIEAAEHQMRLTDDGRAESDSVSKPAAIGR